MNYKAILSVLILLVVFIKGWWSLKPPSAPSPSSTPSTAEETLPAKEITVVGDEYRFQPSSISLKSGERVKITFRNNGRAPHNLIVEQLRVETKTIGAGQTDILEFTATTPGIYTFFCSLPGHRPAGMEGNLTIE